MSQESDPNTNVERVDLQSLDVGEQKRQDLLRLFPEVRTEGGKIDFERLKLILGAAVDFGKERYGLMWPGKAECFRTIQTPSTATLRPMREESINFDTTENLIIEGDNLEVLKLLQKAYLGTLERRPVRDRDRVYEIDGTDSRMLATVGAFRVVAESDLHDGRDDTRKAQRHLEQEGLLRTSRVSSDDRAVVLTDRGRDLLEANRYERDDRSHERRQTFWAGLRKPRELTHDTRVYRAYRRSEERLRDGGGRVRRVVLDYELKRDYQRFLHERNRGKKNCDGRPDREPEEIARWAQEHELPYDEGHVRFPDARIEYEDRDGRSRHEDLEVVTGHYRGAHAGSTAKSGFTCYLSTGCSVGGRGGGRRTAHPRIIEELLR